ncbi:hypothetical protein EV215_0340 [Hypnocyclicus thermotrophus]|uniref:Uncharacterized protein n=1 Tax=Hypnocyclicus thermotrophus TaxID=1627895 RepID=A0AA46E0H4_9FUSO|nr:SiaB family protein kinase [Hypnocyclicus thermotrophus]TDT72530.1 hypothetical protein EV215_0340 [Hypnocyclicus thermotrophus]
MGCLNFFEVEKILKNNHILIFFEGNFTQKKLYELVESLKNKLNLNYEHCYLENNYSILKKVCSIFIEMAQNIQLHSLKQNNLKNGIIIAIEKEKNYKIYSGNNVSSEIGRELIEKCNYLNSLNSTEIKKLYKKKLKEPRLNKNSAGLGLIYMRKNSLNSLKAEIKKIDKNTSFFTLEVTIDKEGI